MTISDDFAALELDLIADGLWTHEITLQYGPRQSQVQPWSKSSGPSVTLVGQDDDAAGDGFLSDGFSDGGQLVDGNIDAVTFRATAERKNGRVNDAGEIRDYWLILVPAGLLDVAPTPEDAVLIESIERQIIGVQPVYAQDTAHFYYIMAER